MLRIVSTVLACLAAPVLAADPPATPVVSAAVALPATFGVSAEPGDVRLSFGEHAAAAGLEGDAAVVVCDDLSERLALCYTWVEAGVRRYVTRAELAAWGLDREALRARAVAGAAGRVGASRPAPVAVEGGGQYRLSAEGDGWDVAALLQPEALRAQLGGQPVVAVPQRNTLLAWRSGDAELDTIMAVGVKRMHEAAEAPVSPLLYAWDGDSWEVWGEAKRTGD